MTTHLLTGALAAVLLLSDLLSLLAPAITLSDEERLDLDRGFTVARTLKSGDGQVGVFAMSRIDVPPVTLITHARAIEDLKRSSFVTAIKRFSDPPRTEDLDALVLSPRDRQAALECTVGKCSFKFTAAEIDLLRAAIDASADPEAAVPAAFKRVLLARVNSYLTAGLPGVADVANRSTPVCLDRVYRAILAATPLSLTNSAAAWLRDSPKDAVPVESFLYWSQENYGAGKPVVLVNHIGLFAPERPGDPAIVIGKQVFASRYMTGGLALTAITTDTATGANYLMHLNRTGVDVLGGVLGPFKRAMLESRLKGELPEIIQKLRARLERRTLPPSR